MRLSHLASLLGVASTNIAVWAEPEPSKSSGGCSSHWDCSLNGVCDDTSGKCNCRAAWSGESCTSLNLLPLEPARAQQVTFFRIFVPLECLAPCRPCGPPPACIPPWASEDPMLHLLQQNDPTVCVTLFCRVLIDGQQMTACRKPLGAQIS